MQIDGSCHCGAITYTAEVDPARAVICRCTDCQTFSSAPFRTSVPVKAENFHMRGVPKTYVKTADSGNKRVQAFCGTCGTPVYTTSTDERPARYNLRLGAIRQSRELIPQLQGFCRSAQSWAMDISAIPRAPV